MENGVGHQWFTRKFTVVLLARDKSEREELDRDRESKRVIERERLLSVNFT